MTDNRTTERVDHPPRVREAIDGLMREKDANDNRTTELRRLLTERGIEYETNDHMGVCETSWNGFTAMQLTPGAKLMMAFTPEQAIAATLGNSRADYHGYEQAAIEAWESVKAWNSRAERTCKIIEWYEARDRHEIGNNRVRFSCGDIGTCHDKFCPECGARVVS